MTFKRIAALTLPTLSHKKTNTYYMKVLGPIYKGKQLPAKPGKEAEPPADCLRVLDLSSGEEGEYLLPTVVKDRFVDMKDNAYVGRCFEITKLGRREGKRYDDYAVYEIADPAKEAAKVPAEKAAK